jgi:regulatory protein
MKITGLTAQQKNNNRVNVMVDGAYRFSLDIFQVAELGISVGKDYSEAELTRIETESLFGKLYGRALEYVMSRPHSAKEVRDYLYRKTRDTRTKTGAVKPGYPVEITERVYDRLVTKQYINDAAFARYWAENRNQRKGTSQRKLVAELRAKGVEQPLIEQALEMTGRLDSDELQKVIAKKRARYDDPQKLMRYLAGQGFSYDDIKQALDQESELSG